MTSINDLKDQLGGVLSKAAAFRIAAATNKAAATNAASPRSGLNQLAQNQRKAQASNLFSQALGLENKAITLERQGEVIQAEIEFLQGFDIVGGISDSIDSPQTQGSRNENNNLLIPTIIGAVILFL